MNSVFNELPETVFMDINAAGLTVMNFTFDDCWVGTGLDFKTGNSIVVDVVFLEISLEE